MKRSKNKLTIWDRDGPLLLEFELAIAKAKLVVAGGEPRGLPPELELAPTE